MGTLYLACPKQDALKVGSKFKENKRAKRKKKTQTC